jgi:hypothetical protein
MRENRETLWLSFTERQRTGGRKPKANKAHMHGYRESYATVVPTKQPNNGGSTARGGCGGKEGDQGEHGAI